jgi:hypothetical protein
MISKGKLRFIAASSEIHPDEIKKTPLAILIGYGYRRVRYSKKMSVLSFIKPFSICQQGEIS